MSSPSTRQLPPVRSVPCLPIFYFLFSIFFLALFCARTALALDPSLDVSQYAHTAWKVRDGFVKGALTAITQTPDGYLWLGTTFGLYRFDGVRAVPWELPAGQQLPSNAIDNLLVARDGTLWIGTLKGLASWKDSKLTLYPEVAGHMVGQLLQDRDGTVWVTVSGPGSLCGIQGEKLQCYGAGSLGNYALALYEDHEGNLWVWGTTGIWRWKPGLPKGYGFPRPTEVDSLIEDDTGALLLASSDGLMQLVRGKIQSYGLPSVTGKFRPNIFLRSSDGSLWIGSRQGLFHLHQGKTDVFTVADGLSGDLVANIFEDREGSVWVSTTRGLDRFRDYAVRRISRNQGLSTNDAYSIQATEDGAIWIGTSDRLNRWNNGHVSVYNTPRVRGLGESKDDRKANIGGAVTEVANSELEGIPRSLGLNDQGRLWISTSEGAFFFDGVRFVRVPGVQTGNILPEIAGDGHGKVWFGDSVLGLFHLTPGDNAKPIPWVQFGQKNFGAQSLLSDRSDGGLWLGFLEGGIAYFKDGRVRTSFTVVDGLGKGRVDHLRFGSRGALWAATEGGLSRIKGGHIETLNSKNGLPCDAVHWSVEDDDHAMWVYMPCGLARIERSEWYAWVDNPRHVIETINFDSSDGVPSIGFYGGYGPRVTKSPDGKIWFVTYDGIGMIDPRRLQFNRLPPPVHIEQIAADGKVYDTSSAGNGRGPLPALVRDLTIDYTALSLVVPEKVRFRVKLEGQDKDWRELTDRRVRYTNLAPKHYRFLVKACNNSGLWNEEGAALEFAILPAYYQTSWFRTLCVAAFLGLLWILHRVRVRILEQRQELLERNQTLIQRHATEITALNDRMMKAQEEERTRIAGELHDGVLQQISSITLLLGAVKYKVPANSEANEKIVGLQQRLIEVGTEIRELSHELHPAVLKEGGLPEALSDYCKEFSTTRGIPVTCETDATAKELSRGAALVLYRIAQEALGNVAKHSQAKHVQVRLMRINGRVRLTVTDDGVGCSPDRIREAGGLGLVNMRERTRQLKGTFEFQSEPGRGSTVTAEVPFRPES